MGMIVGNFLHVLRCCGQEGTITLIKVATEGFSLRKRSAKGRQQQNQYE